VLRSTFHERLGEPVQTVGTVWPRLERLDLRPYGCTRLGSAGTQPPALPGQDADRRKLAAPAILFDCSDRARQRSSPCFYPPSKRCTRLGSAGTQPPALPGQDAFSRLVRTLFYADATIFARSTLSTHPSHTPRRRLRNRNLARGSPSATEAKICQLL
jgi:hypothetical protein